MGLGFEEISSNRAIISGRICLDKIPKVGRININKTKKIVRRRFIVTYGFNKFNTDKKASQ